MHRVALSQACAMCLATVIRSRVTCTRRTFSALGGQLTNKRLHESEHVGQLSRHSSCNVGRLQTGMTGVATQKLRLTERISSPFSQNRRFLSTSDDDGTEGKVKPVFVSIPNPIKVVRNKIFFWLIRSYFDPDFRIEDFTQGARQALVTISQQIAAGAWENLEGLLSPKLLGEIQKTCHNFSLKELSSLSVDTEDILYTFPHDIAIHYDDKGGKFLFILMKFWCHSTQAGSSDPEVKGFRIGRPPPGVSEEQFDSLGSVYSCTYEFHRNITPGASAQWMITYMQHGQLIHTETRGLPEE